MAEFKKIGLGLLLLLIVSLVSVGQVSALPAFNDTLQSVFGNASCGICHISPLGGGNLTTYGLAFDSQMNLTNENVTASLMAIGPPGNATSNQTGNKTGNQTGNQTGNETGNVTLPPFTMSATPQSMTVDPDVPAVYSVSITNNGNATDTYNLTVGNTGEANASLSVDSLTVDANSSGNTELTVVSNATGTFAVTVTATSEADPNNSMTVSTNTTVGNVTPTVPFTIVATPSSIITSANETVTYSLQISNNGTTNDTFDLAIENPSNIGVNLSEENVTVEALSSAEVLLTVNSPENGTFMVNVTATSRENPANQMTVSTTTMVGEVPPPVGVMAIRTIENMSLDPSESTMVMVNFSTNMTQALSLREIIPEGWNLTRVTDDADSFKDGGTNNEWLFVNVTPDMTKTVIYKLTVPANVSIGKYFINGTLISSQGVIATVDGNAMISVDIVGHYTRLGNNPNKVETLDALKAIEDWRNGVKPDGFPSAPTHDDVLTLITDWAMS